MKTIKNDNRKTVVYTTTGQVGVMQQNKTTKEYEWKQDDNVDRIFGKTGPDNDVHTEVRDMIREHVDIVWPLPKGYIRNLIK